MASLGADGDAFVDARGTRTSYAELRAAVATASRALEGAGEGALVAIGETAPLPTLIAALATWAIGGVVLPLDPRAPSASRDRALGKARPHVVVGAGFTIAQGDHPRARLPGAALCLFTSGSTAEPKLVVLGADGILANVRAILDYLPVAEAGVVALASPLAYSYGLVGQALTALVAGATLVDIASLPFANEQLAALVEHGVRGLSSVPTALRSLARAVNEVGTPGSLRPREDTGPRLRFVASAGAPLDASAAELLRKAFPDAELFNQYGLTEASPRVSAISSRSHAAAFAAGSVGRALPGLELRVSDEGRLFVRGPSVMLGYADDPAATRAVLDDAGWLETGDVGRLDEQGNLFVEGRRDGVVKCAGERVSVEEIAALLRRADGVRDAHVLAAPHAETGVSLWAFVECAATDVPRLRAFLRAELSPAKRPAHLVAVDALPRGPSGKVAAQDLHARIQAKKREKDDAA